MPKADPDYEGIAAAARRIFLDENRGAGRCTCPGPTMTDLSCPIHGEDD